MAIERKLPGWSLGGRWVLTSTVAFTAGAFVGMCLAWVVVGVVPAGETTPELFSRAYLDSMLESISGPGEDLGRELRYSAFYGPGGELFYWGVTIALGGWSQWLLLRKHTAWAVAWALPVPLALAYHGLTADNPLPVGGGVWLLATYAKDFGIGAALYSTLVGVPLVWFLRRSYRKSSKVGNGSSH